MAENKDDRLKNIIKIDDGVYEIQISNGFRDDGKRDRITKTVHGDEEYAIAFRDNLKKELAEKKKRNLKAANEGYTFLEVTKAFLEDKEFSKRVGTTNNGYKTYLNNYILPELADKKIRNITDDDLKDLYKKMANTKSRSGKGNLTGTTIKHTHRLIGTIFNFAKYKKWTLYNPVDFVKTPKSDSPEREYYDKEEIAYALECLYKMPEHKNGVSDNILHMQNLRFKTAITILFNSGLRRGELLGLKWEDIKYKTGIFKIQRSIATIDSKEFDPEDIVEDLRNGLVCKHLKNDSSRRDIHMPQVCFDLLGTYKEAQRKWGLPTSDNDFIFQNIKTPGVWNPNNLTNEWRKFIKDFKLKSITIHDIRHSHATDLISMGVPIKDVSRRLGHSDVATTLRIYCHSNLGDDKVIIDRLESRYGNTFVTSNLSIGVVVSIVSGIDFASYNEISNGISFIMGREVEEEQYLEMKDKCKEYIISQCNYFKDILMFIDNNMNDVMKSTFLNIICNMSKDISNIKPLSSCLPLM